MPKQFEEILITPPTTVARTSDAIEFGRIYRGSTELTIEILTESTDYQITFQAKGFSEEWYNITAYRMDTAELGAVWTNEPSALYQVIPSGASAFRLVVNYINDADLYAAVVVTI